MSRAIIVNVSARVVPELPDQLARRVDFALQRGFRLARDADADQVDRRADREEREHRRRHEDASAQRRQKFHRRGKSSSVAPPSGTVMAWGSDAVPSCQAITLYVPRGTRSIR